MALSLDVVNEVLAKYQRFPGDTGSPEAQVALFSSRITQLTEHLKQHMHDHHSRRGLLTMVNKRRKLLDYLKRVNSAAYLTLIEGLGIRR